MLFFLVLTGRLIHSAHRYSSFQLFKVPQRAAPPFTLTNSSLSQVSEHQPTQQSIEHHQTVFFWTYGALFLLSQKFAGSRGGEVNIAECLILHTCGDYIPFDIRYALVKWVFGAFLSQAHIQVHVCWWTHVRSDWRHLLMTGICSIWVYTEKKGVESLLLPPAESHPHKNNLIYFLGSRLRLFMMVCTKTIQFHASRPD